MKRTAALAVIICIFIYSLCSCSKESFSLTINNIEIPEEIYNYFLSVAENDEAYSDAKDKSDAALELCKKYTAENEIIKKNGVSLSAEEKVSVSSDTKAQWLYFGSFYEKYSVSKQTLNMIIEHNRLFDDAVAAIYSENGEKPLSEKKIRKFFEENYIAVQIISTNFTDENGNPSDEKEIEEITENFTVMRNTVRNGGSMESAAQQFPEFAEYEGEASIISAFDTSYPSGLFKDVSELEKGGAQVYRYKSMIYLIHRLEDSDDDIFYSLYSKDCIIKMKKNEVKKSVNALAKSYKMVYNNLK